MMAKGLPSKNSIVPPPVWTLVKGNLIYVAALALVAVSTAIEPSFLSTSNIANILSQIAPLGVVVIGQSFVLLARGLDLSIASTMAAAAVVLTVFPRSSGYTVPVIFVSILIGLATGLVNGVLVAKRKVSPFLATLATMIVLQGLRFYWTQGAATGEVPALFRTLGAGNIFGVPINFIILMAIGAVFWVVLHRSSYGRRVFMVGGSPEAARLVGIGVDRVIISTYMISGGLAAVAGVLLAGYVGTIDGYLGRGFELQSIVAAVIGGVALTGGQGSLPHALTGAAILVIVSNAVLLFGIPVQFQIVLSGLIVIAVAAFQRTKAS